MMPGKGQMPLACLVPLASREVQIQLMGSYSVTYPDLVFRERVPCSQSCAVDCDIGKWLPSWEPSRYYSLVITAVIAGCSFRLAR